MNSWCLVGNLGHTPRIRHLPTGKAVLNLHVAVNERDYVEGEWKTVTMWVDVTVFGPRADALNKILSKGMKVAARGRAKVREYTGRDGSAKWALELVADDVEPLEAPRRGEVEPDTSRPMRRPEHRDQLRDRDEPAFCAPPFPGDDRDIPF